MNGHTNTHLVMSQSERQEADVVLQFTFQEYLSHISQSVWPSLLTDS